MIKSVIKNCLVVGLGAVIGFMLAIYTEPVALKTGTCYVSPTGHKAQLEMFVEGPDSPLEIRIGTILHGSPTEITSWKEYLLMKVESIKECYK